MSSLLETVGACPHDCPDTCSLVTTVEDGRAVAACAATRRTCPPPGCCAPRSRAVDERTHHPGGLLTPLRAASAPRARDVRAHRLGPGAGRSGRAPGQLAAARDAQGVLPYSYCGTMGLVQGESMDRRFFHRLGASLLEHHLRHRRRRGAGAHAGRQGRHAHRVLRRKPVDPDLGQQLHRQQPALLAAGAAGPPQWRAAGVGTSAPRPPTNATSTCPYAPAPTPPWRWP